MSLIHEALKKLEGSRAAGDRPGTVPLGSGAARVRTGAPARRLLPVLAAVVSVVVSAAAVYIYLNSAGPRAPAQVRSVPEAAAVSPDARGAATTGTKAPEGQPSAPDAPVEAGGREVEAASLNSEGILLYNSGRYADAAATFRASVDADPESAVYRNNLALALMRSGSTDEAAREFTRALEVRPEYPEALNNFGSLLAAGGEHERALGLFTRAASIDAGYAEPHLNAAVSYERTGRTAEAIESYERFMGLATDPDVKTSVHKKVLRLRASLLVGS